MFRKHNQRVNLSVELNVLVGEKFGFNAFLTQSRQFNKLVRGKKSYKLNSI